MNEFIKEPSNDIYYKFSKLYTVVQKSLNPEDYEIGLEALEEMERLTDRWFA